MWPHNLVTLWTLIVMSAACAASGDTGATNAPMPQCPYSSRANSGSEHSDVESWMGTNKLDGHQQAGWAPASRMGTSKLDGHQQVGWALTVYCILLSHTTCSSLSALRRLAYALPSCLALLFALGELIVLHCCWPVLLPLRRRPSCFVLDSRQVSASHKM